MEFLTVNEIAKLMDCTKQNVDYYLNKHNIDYEIRLNNRNRPTRMISLELLPKDIQIKYMKDKGLIRNTTTGVMDIERFSNEEREEITMWIKLIEEWQTCRNKKGVQSKIKVDEMFINVKKLENPDLNISSDILYRKWRSYKTGNYIGLLDKRGKAKKGKTSIPDISWDAFLSFYLDQAQHPIKRCYEYMLMYIKENSPDIVPDIPSYTTYFRRLQKDVTEAIKILGREGEKAFDDRCAPYIKRTYDNMKSNDYWIADNHTFDVMVEGENGKPHRLYLTAFLDARSYTFVGCYVTSAPSSQSTIIALRNGIMKYGIPRNLYVDNGREFLTFDVGGLGHRKRKNDDRYDVPTILDRLGIKMTNAIVRNAKAKVIERAFLDVKNSISRLFTSYTGGSVAEKPEILKLELKEGNMPTDAQFTEIINDLLENYFNYEEYNGSVQADKGLKRIEVYNKNLLTKTVASAEELNLMLMRSVRPKKVTRRGVKLKINNDCIEYWNNDLVLNYLGQQVYFRYDPMDLSHVRIYDLEDRYIMNAEADNVAVLEYGASKDEVKNAMDKVRKAKKITKQALQTTILSNIDRNTALELVLKEAEKNKQSTILQANIKDIDIHRADEKPLLHEISIQTDLDKMTRNAEERMGGNKYA